MNKKMFCICSLLIALHAHGFYGPRVHNAQLAFYNPLKPNADFIDSDCRKVESKYDDLRLADLEELTDPSSKDLKPIDKEHIRYLINKIEIEYAKIKDAWTSNYDYPIKSIQWVSFNNICTYLDKNVDFGKRVKALANRSGDHQK